MSLIPPGASPSAAINHYASVQVAVTCVALYDHALALGREVELIWMKPLSLVTALYVIERYLGDVVLVAGLCCIRLFELRAWGALAYSWATQVIMQLRIYAMYRRSRRILVLLLTLFSCEITAIAFIIWQEIGPSSSLKAINSIVTGDHFCAFFGVDGGFIYIFIPFLCFESVLFLLVARTVVSSMRRNREASDDKPPRASSYVNILARDSLCYFIVNLVACSVVMGLWQSVTVLYANICVPLVMLLEVLLGTRLILDFRERYASARLDEDVVEGTVVSGGCSSLHFRGDDIPMESVRVSVRCQIDTIVVTDAGA